MPNTVRLNCGDTEKPVTTYNTVRTSVRNSASHDVILQRDIILASVDQYSKARPSHGGARFPTRNFNLLMSAD